MEKKMFGKASGLIFARAKDLREKETHAELILWMYLKSRPLGYKFRRQHTFSNFILDFYCHALKIAIEVDGSIHDLADVKERDQLRQNFLEQNGLTVLRFKNDDVISRLEFVKLQLENYLSQMKNSE